MNKIIKNVIKLNSKKVALLAVLIAFYLVLSFLSKIFNLTIFPNAIFLKIELSDFVFILGLFLIGKFYTTIMIVLVSLLRMFYLADSIVDAFALMLSDLLYIWFFIGFYYFLTKTLSKTMLIKNNFAKQYLILIWSLIGATLLTSMLMTFFNWLFIYNMYAWIMNYPVSVIVDLKKILLTIVIPFNIIKFSFNSIILFSLYPVIFQITNKLNLTYLPILMVNNYQSSSYFLPDFKEEIYF